METDVLSEEELSRVFGHGSCIFSYPHTLSAMETDGFSGEENYWDIMKTHGFSVDEHYGVYWDIKVASALSRWSFVISQRYQSFLDKLTPLHRWTFRISQCYQSFLDKLTPRFRSRWIAFSFVALAYLFRVLYFVRGHFYFVSYWIAIYVLYYVKCFLTNQAPELPTRSSDEFRPLVRRISEFTLWFSLTLCFCIAFVATFVSCLDIPIFGFLLLIGWLYMFCYAVASLGWDMKKYKYNPFSSAEKVKPRYGASPTLEESASIIRE